MPKLPWGVSGTEANGWVGATSFVLLFTGRTFGSMNIITAILGLSITHQAAPQPPPWFLTQVYVFFALCLGKISAGVSPVVQSMLDYLITVLCSDGAFFIFAVFYPDQAFFFKQFCSLLLIIFRYQSF